MSFFNRNNPDARRVPPPPTGGGGGGSPAHAGAYDRLPSGRNSPAPTQPSFQQPPPPNNNQYSQQPAQQQSIPRRPPPPQDPFQQGQGRQPTPGGNANYSQPTARAVPQQGGYEDYPREKAEYVPQQQGRGYGGSGYYGGGGGGGHGGRPQRGNGMYQIVPCPTDALALTNKLVINPNDFGDDVEYVKMKGRYVISVIRDPTSSVPSQHIGPSKGIRSWAMISAMQGEKVELEVYSPQSGDWAGMVEMEIGFVQKRFESAETWDTESLSDFFTSNYAGLAVTPGQTLFFDIRSVTFKATIRSVSTLAGEEGDIMGLVNEGTEVRWVKESTSTMKLKNTSKRAPTTAILAPNFKFEDMGIGGLDTEFSAIFRRAFASRIFPPGLVEKLGIQHVKGILLFGPPGTGKTLMARQIGKMLNAREPKVVNGPEILNKYVGASEENIRKLFADAEKEQKEKGDESGLNIIIFDELDAICKQRGSDKGGTGVGDSVVNQLLSKMDGVDQLNNVLIIGMTNRYDMIDEALLRPGRLEVHIEISLPDEAGRVQILGIHTSKMKKNGVMGDDVDIHELAALTKNFSGAEIGGLVKSATSFAFNRHVKVGTVAGISDDIENIKIMRADFMAALEEVHAAFGVSEEELQEVVQNGIIHFSPEIDTILRDGNLFVEQVKNSARTPLVSVLVHGPPGSGKSALAATMAIASDFPFIKLISPESMVGYTESQKVAQLNKIFNDSYKSPMSVIVIDSIERLLDWIPIGPRFSNNVLQALMVLLGKRPPKGRRLLVFATTSNRAMLSDMEMTESFDADIRVPPITSLRSIELVLREVQLFSSTKEAHNTMRLLEEAGFGEDGKLNVGVKKLLSMAEMARQDPDVAEKFVGSLIQYRG